MTFEELHEILDNEDRKLSKAELEEVIYELKQDCANEVYKRTVGTTDEQMEIQFYNGEQNAFQIVLDLLEHLIGNDDLEKRVKALEDYNEQQRQKQIKKLEAENKMLEAQLKRNGMPSLEDWLKAQKLD